MQPFTAGYSQPEVKEHFTAVAKHVYMKLRVASVEVGNILNRISLQATVHV